MGGLAEVLKRIAGDRDFADQLIDDPRKALASYRLSADDLDVVAAAVAAKAQALGTAAPGARRSALVNLLTPLVEPGTTPT